jgi:hypothetical protein
LLLVDAGLHFLVVSRLPVPARPSNHPMNRIIGVSSSIRITDMG